MQLPHHYASTASVQSCAKKPPSLGQDSLTVLAEFGYSPPEIEAFISKGVVVGQ